MRRTLVLMLFFTAACARRETVSGNWTGGVGPDAGSATLAPPTDESTPVGGPGRGALDAAPGKSTPDAAAPTTPSPELHPPDASGQGGAAAPDARPATADDPGFAARDASPDLGDAHPCPDADRCD